jgi:hypothetical protein
MRIGDIERVGEREIPMPKLTPKAPPAPAPHAPQREREPREPEKVPFEGGSNGTFAGWEGARRRLYNKAEPTSALAR